MAINNAAVLKPNTAHFYTAPEGTALPVDLRAPDVAWTHMGHTSLESILAATSEGGDQTILGSLQNKSLRTSTSQRTETFAVNLLQLDIEAVKLYFGSNATVDGTNSKVVHIPADPTPSTVAWLCVLYDGTNDAGFYAAKAEVIRGEDLSISDTESLTQLPVRITPLVVDGATSAYSLILPHAHVTPGP